MGVPQGECRMELIVLQSRMAAWVLKGSHTVAAWLMQSDTPTGHLGGAAVNELL